MPFSYWFVLLTVHIALPAVIFFVVVFYTWRFFAFIRRKFIEFRHRVDGYDHVNNRPQRKNHTRHPQRRDLEEFVTSSVYLKPMTLKGERNDYEAHLQYKSKYQPVALTKEVQEKGYDILKKQGRDEFYQWLIKRMAERRYSDMTYTSLKNINEQLIFYTKRLFSNETSNIAAKDEFWFWCLFVELNILKDKNYTKWVQQMPKR